MQDDIRMLQEEAEKLGLRNLSERHLTQFARAKAAAQRMIAEIPRELPIDVEPAHTFRASQEA